MTVVSLGREPQNLTGWTEYFEGVLPLFRDFTPVIQDLFEDVEANKVVTWVRSSATSPIGPYANEYWLAFYFTEDQTKVETFLESVDAGVSRDFFPKLNEWVAEHPDLEW